MVPVSSRPSMAVWVRYPDRLDISSRAGLHPLSALRFLLYAAFATWRAFDGNDIGRRTRHDVPVTEARISRAHASAAHHEACTTPCTLAVPRVPIVCAADVGR